MVLQDHLLLDDGPVLVQAPLQGVHLPLGADPQLLADHADEALVVANQDNAALKGKEGSNEFIKGELNTANSYLIIL